MISKRIAFVSAISFAVLALFVISSAEAAPPVLNNPFMDPADSRVDGSQPMSFSIEYNDTENRFPTSFVVIFEGVSTEADMECLSSGCIDLTNPNGTWTVIDTTQPLANTLVANVGSDEISYNFVATVSGEDDACYLSCGYWEPSGVRVNTIPVLTDNATVTGGGMPEDTYTLSITYTDEDGHAGAISATVCETSNASNCDATLSLLKSSGDETTGAVYSTDFETSLGGALTVTVSGGDTFDSADSRTTTFSVDTETPWLKNPSVSPTSTGVAGNVSFSVVYCVFDADMGTPTVQVTVGSASAQAMSAGANNSDCKNGVDYSLTTTVAWAAAAQSVTFSASDDAESAADVDGSPVTINDAPTLSAGSAERDADNFILNVSAADINSDDGDSLSVFATIEFDTERAMSCDGDGNCTVTVAEADIISQRGGTRSVTFRVQDSHTVSTGGDFGNSIDVTRTSSFILSGPGDQTPQPGSSDYTFTVENNGNSEDTFSISASSLNNWVSASSDPSVTVAYDSSETFTITMDVPHVAAGTTDSWSVDVTAGNNGTQTSNDEGTTTVDVVSGHTVTIADSSSNADPGATATYYFTITNTGNADASFSYTTTGSPATGSTTLGMGDSETVAVSHTIGSASAAGDQSTVTFTSGSESATATTTTNQIYGVTISLQSTTDNGGISPGETFDAVYTVTNTGNGADAVTVDFNADWLTGASGTTHNLAGFGGTGTATATLTAPSNAASDSSSSITAFATGSGSSGDSGPTSLDVASNSRSVSLSSSVSSYTINQGSSGTGTVTVTNGGVASTFAVISMSPSLSFATSEITLGATGTILDSGDLTFTINAAESGDFTFTIADAIDGSSATYTGTVVARVFDVSTLTSSTDDCGSTGVVCETDSGGGWDGNGYTNSGTWSTTKTLTDSNGQSGTVIFDTTIPNAAPSVSSLSAENGVVAGEERTFMFMVPSDSDGTISHFVIDFGDGNSETFEGSDMTGSTVTSTHTYESAGEFSVTATAYDNSGDYTTEAVTVNVAERTVTLDGSSYTYNLVALVGFFVLGMLLAGTAFKMQQGEIAGDEEMNERDRQRLESVERRMESLAEREELLEVSAYDASRAATKLEEHISAFNEVLVRAQEIAAEEKLQELEAAEAAREKEEEQMQLDLEDPDIEMVAERFHDSLGRLVKARDELSKIEEQLAHILKMERDEQLEKLTSMTESYESTKRKIDALQSTKEARDATADESSIMNLLSAAASGAGAADFGGFDDLGDSDEYEVEIYEDEDGSFYYIDPDTGEEIPCDEDGNAL